MEISIIEETDTKITLKLEDTECPYCRSNQLNIKGCMMSNLNKKFLKEFFKKEIYLKKNRYICKCCGKTFTIKCSFKERVFDTNLKPILKFLFDIDLIKITVLDKEIKRKLNLNDDWYVLNQSKILTLINKENLEIKEFSKIQKEYKKKNFIDDKEQIIVNKTTDYIEFKRKVKYRITT